MAVLNHGHIIRHHRMNMWSGNTDYETVDGYSGGVAVEKASIVLALLVLKLCSEFIILESRE